MDQLMHDFTDSRIALKKHQPRVFTYCKKSSCHFSPREDIISIPHQTYTVLV